MARLKEEESARRQALRALKTAIKNAERISKDFSLTSMIRARAQNQIERLTKQLAALVSVARIAPVSSTPAPEPLGVAAGAEVAAKAEARAVEAAEAAASNRQVLDQLAAGVLSVEEARSRLAYVVTDEDPESKRRIRMMRDKGQFTADEAGLLLDRLYVPDSDPFADTPLNRFEAGMLRALRELQQSGKATAEDIKVLQRFAAREFAPSSTTPVPAKSESPESELSEGKTGRDL